MLCWVSTWVSLLNILSRFLWSMHCVLGGAGVFLNLGCVHLHSPYVQIRALQASVFWSLQRLSSVLPFVILLFYHMVFAPATTLQHGCNGLEFFKHVSTHGTTLFRSFIACLRVIAYNLGF